MADPYTPLFDEDPDAPFMPAQAQPRVLKRALARPAPIGVPNAAPRGAPLTAPTAVDAGDDYRQKALALLAQAQGTQPSEADVGAMREYARKRDEQSKRDFLLGTAMSMGGSSFAPVGAQVLKQALAAQGPEKLGGGIVQGGEFFTDPEVTAQRHAARLETQAKIYESMAANASTVAAREQAAQLAAQARADARANANSQQQSNQDLRRQQQVWHTEDNMRSHFDTVTKNTRDVLNEARVVAALPADGRLSPIQQQSLMVLINKFQDPGSVVREGEFNRVAAAQGILQKLGNLPQRLASGQPIPPALVRDIQNVIGLYTQAAENTMRANAVDYFKVARQRGLDPTAIVTDHRWHPVEQQQQDQPGGRGIDVGARLSGSGRTQVDY
jgi:hypothetical protein